MKKGFSFKGLWDAFKAAFKGFSDHKVTKLSASLAYYTIFSLGPLLVVIIYICSILLNEQAIQGTINDQLSAFIGHDAATQIQEIIKNASISGKGGVAAIIGIVTLLIGATSMFAELQDSMNSIWGVKSTPKAGIMKLVKDRLLSFGLVATLGFLLLVSLAATAAVEGIGSRLEAMFPDKAVVLIYIVNLVLTIAVVTFLFAIIFKVLPDVQLPWKSVWPGAIATTFLFLIGKFAISLYISKTNVGSTYGSAGSLIIILLWIYYSAIILYYGAEFTKAYAIQHGADIKPKKLAEWDDKPAIAGAKPAGEAYSNPSGNKERAREVYPHLVPVSQQHSQRDDNKQVRTYSAIKNKKPGVGITLVGLALYFITKNKG